MRRTFNFLLLFFLSVMTVMAAPGDLQEKLASLKGISGIEKLQSDYYPEKYVVRITQQVDPKDPAAGTFTQRVIVGHVGYHYGDRRIWSGLCAQSEISGRTI